MTRIEFLGTGTSHGVPVIGCHCGVCSSSDPRDKRWRSSICITRGNTHVVIDTGYEFRLQALRAGIDSLDGVLYTHAHSDHLMGLDDLRVFSRDRKMPIYSSAKTLETIKSVFPYAFKEWQYKGVPSINPVAVEERVPFTIGEITFIPVPVMHGMMRILGYRFGSAAYITDVSDLLLDENREVLSGVKTLIVGALRDREHWSHFTFSQAAEAGRAIGAEDILFTHINHETFHADIERRFKGIARPGYDTLVLEADDE